MKRASAYRLRDRFLIHPESKTTSGVWLATAPYVPVPLDSGPEALGEAIASALAASGSGVPHPTSWTGLSKPRLEAAGSKSEADFMRGARLVHLALDRTAMRFEATNNGGTKGEAKGFSEIRASARTLPTVARFDEVGAALFETLSGCTSAE